MIKKTEGRVYVVRVLYVAYCIFMLGAMIVGIMSLINLTKIAENQNIRNVYTTDLEINALVTTLMQTGRTEEVYEFYSSFTRNREITHNIIIHALTERLPLHVAFGTAWTESNFNPTCIYQNKDKNGRVLSIDFGLFQLNSESFPRVKKEELLDVKLNTSLACKTLMDNYTKTGSWFEAICMYNRGHVTDLGIKYTSKVWERIEFLNKAFNEEDWY